MKTYRYYLWGILMILSLPSIAQKRFSVGITAAPVISHSSTRLSFTLPDGKGQFYQETFDNRSTTGGYIVGIPIQYNVTPKWSISSGVWFNQFRSTGNFPFALSSSGNAVPARVISSSYRVPLTVNYCLTTQKLSPFFSVGAVGSFRGIVKYKPEEGSGLQDTELKFGRHKVSVQALVGAGVAYQINPHWSLTAQPLLIWSFKPSSNYERYVSYQVNGQVQLLYSF